MSAKSDGSAALRLDTNLATETKRILYVLDKTVRRAKFISSLGVLIRDEGRLLSEVLNDDDHFFVIQTCRKYEYEPLTGISRKESLTESVSPTTAGPDVKPSSVTVGSRRSSYRSLDVSEDETFGDKTESGSVRVVQRVDDELSKVIFLLENHPGVRELSEKIETEASPQIKFFIRCLEELRDGVELHLGETAREAKRRENHLRECYSKNEKAKKEILALEEELVVKKTDANACIIGKNILINRHQNRIERIQKTSLEVIEKRIKESEKAMANDWKTSSETQARLKEEMENARTNFENLLRDHLQTEKQLRTKRTKVENQLLGWLQKFDQDIGEKQTEEEEVQARLDEEKKQLEKIQRKLEEQEEEYDELMQEKAEYEQEVLEHKLYIFILNRSARRIQRSFRAYKARKLAKKKAKKEKKGKKGKK